MQEDRERDKRLYYYAEMTPLQKILFSSRFGESLVWIIRSINCENKKQNFYKSREL